MNQAKKHKSGSLKRKEREKRKLEEAQNDPNQAKLARFFRPETAEVLEPQETIVQTVDQPVYERIPSDVDEESADSRDCSSGAPDGSDQADCGSSPIEALIPTPYAVEDTQQQESTFENFVENDKGLCDESSPWTEDRIKNLLLRGPCQPSSSDMPDGRFKETKDKRRFNSSFYSLNTQRPFMKNDRSPWISYSPSANYAYCHFCWLFGDRVTRKSVWVTGFVDWKHFSGSAVFHGRSKAHLNSALAASTFLQRSSINHQLAKQISEEARKWRCILNTLLDTVRTLAGLGVAFRGHREDLSGDDPGIYLEIIKLISRHNPLLRAHIESPDRIKYLSETITFELLNTLADETCRAILNECKEAKFFSLIADSTTDVAHLDQMAILIRYVVVQRGNGESRKVYIKESFLCFVRLKRGDAASICDEITAILFDKYKLQKRYLCGQSYDGAAVMSGIDGGVQARMRNYVGEGAFLPFVHCLSHQMNLVLVHAAEKSAGPSIRVFFATIETIFKYFSQSHRRWDAILEESRKNSQASKSFGINLLRELRDEIHRPRGSTGEDLAQRDTEDMSRERVLHLKGLSVTRWASRLKAVEATIQNFECIINCVEDETLRSGASGEDIMNARALLSSMNWVFFLNLLWWHSILGVINSAQVQLQKKELDFMMAQRCVSAAAAKLENLRKESTYNEFVQKAKEKWCDMGWEHADFPAVRRRKIRSLPGEMAGDTELDGYAKHRRCYFEVLDGMTCELREREKGFRAIFSLFGFLLPQTLSTIDASNLQRSVDALMRTYPEFFTTDLKFELISFKDLYFTPDRGDSSEHTPLSYLDFVVDNNIMDSFPECCSLFRLFLTLPVGSASAERVMSSLKIVKEYRRATLADTTLNNFCILYIERRVANSLNLDNAIEVFSEQKARRGFKVQ